jgi:hypothetical protein
MVHAGATTGVILCKHFEYLIIEQKLKFLITVPGLTCAFYLGLSQLEPPVQHRALPDILSELFLARNLKAGINHFLCWCHGNQLLSSRNYYIPDMGNMPPCLVRMVKIKRFPGVFIYVCAWLAIISHLISSSSQSHTPLKASVKGVGSSI